MARIFHQSSTSGNFLYTPKERVYCPTLSVVFNAPDFVTQAPIAGAGSSGCVFKHWTGLECPFCGGTRAFIELVQGDLPAALELNAMITLAMPAIAVLALAWTAGAFRLSETLVRNAAVAVLIGTMAFGLLRNQPQFRFLLAG